MLLLDEMELTQEKLKATPKPNTRRFYLRSDKQKQDFKQAVVKRLSNLNKTNIAYAMFYIAKESENQTLKNEKGELVKAQDVLKDWRKNMIDKKSSNEAMHLGFSIGEFKTDKNLEALEKAVEDVMKVNFYEHKYVYTIHKHQGKPHVHVILNKRSKYTNKKMHFKKGKILKLFFKS